MNMKWNVWRSASLLGILLLIGLAVASPALASPAPVFRGNPARPQVAIGLNVVWGTEYVRPILQALAKEHVRITFFLGGTWARQNPEMAHALARAGMEIGNHGNAHRHVASLTLADNEAEITRAEEAIHSATGKTTRLYAPAYGEWNPTVLAAADRLHYRTILWTIDTVDWRKWHTPEIIRSRVLAGLQNGAIILMHPTDRTLAALPTLLQEIHRRGYRVVPVSEVLRP